MTEEQIRQLIEQLTAELRQAQTAGLEPTTQSVRDLEGRLATMEEALRLAQANPVAGGAGAGTPDADAGFRGAFFSNIEQVRQAFRSGMLADGTRAIDTSLFANGGRMNPEQAASFIDYLVEQQITLNRVQTRRMTANQALIEELLVGARKMRGAAENTGPAVVNAASTKKRSLSTTEVIWAEDITLTFLEDNIERRGAEQHIARMLATQFGNDMNDLAWNGDTGTANTDPDFDFLKIENGWLKIAAGDAGVKVVDAAGAGSAKAVLQKTLKALPVKYKGRTDLAFFVPVAFAEKYADEVADRVSPLGDQTIINGLPQLRYFGIPLIPDPALKAAKIELTPVVNKIFGVQRNLTVDSQWQPRKRAVEFTMTARIDFEYANTDAVVLTNNVPAALL